MSSRMVVLPKLTRNFWTKIKPNFGKYQLVVPQTFIVSKEKNDVPDHIPKPSYYATGEPTEVINFPEIKNAEQTSKMRDSCKLAANTLKEIGQYLQVGQTTDELDIFAHNLIVNRGAYPSPLNYRGFPKSICTSVNNVACHGIPDERPLEDGDIINVDITVYYQGYHGDCSKTFLVGNVDELGRDLVEATKTCLYEAIAICEPGRNFKEIGSFIEKKAKHLGYKVMPAFAGHGIGHYFHGPPDIVHIRNDYPGQMKPGMTFTIEPILTQGGPDAVILDDQWTAVSFDDARTAQFEHTILITDSGVEILTVPDQD